MGVTSSLARKQHLPGRLLCSLCYWPLAEKCSLETEAGAPGVCRQATFLGGLLVRGSCSTRNLHFIPFSHLLLNDLPTMDKDRKEITRRILDFTLEIISLLRGEDYIILKMTSEDCFTPIIHDSEGWIQGPISEPHPLIQEQKILEFTHKMIELLTGEVPIRCQDVAVYFSMEEWQYLEGHKNQYMDVMMEDHRPLPSPARSRTGRTGEESPNPPLQDHQGQDLSTINCTVKEESYVLHDERQEDVPAEMYVWGEEEWKEDIPADSLPESQQQQQAVAQTGVAQTGVAQTGVAQTGVAQTGDQVAYFLNQYEEVEKELKRLKLEHKKVQDMLPRSKRAVLSSRLEKLEEEIATLEEKRPL
ncbi:uncharacterized protein LOC122922306 [Bufo gargarizans]|uniref:uncharacterized protein LOC122922306 n=1 Tax=Bufo gargarizans TaxID=30331 RepID=UPI001CF32BB3|nr:uncharacterized protein LOC122922306 [Bufo gargarizans]